MRESKSSPNLENTYMLEVSTTIRNSFHSSTRTTSKHKTNDQCVMNDQTDTHSLCFCKNYYKAFLNDKVNDK